LTVVVSLHETKPHAEREDYDRGAATFLLVGAVGDEIR
jgi:hypothetical protein